MNAAVSESSDFSQTPYSGVSPLPHVLIVDDENGPRQSLRLLLKEEFDVALAENVDMAEAHLQEHEVHVIVTDLRMPRKSGVDLLRYVKGKCPDTQVIILTGYGRLDSAMEAVEHDAFAYMEKPFDSQRMLDQVRGAAERRNQERERRTLEQLAFEANRFSTVGRIVSGLMHDLGTPLSVISNQLELLMRDTTDKDVDKRLGTVRSQVGHCNDMVRSTLNFLRHDHTEHVPFVLNDVIRMCMDVGRPLLRSAAVAVELDLADDLPLCRGEVVVVRQAILNLMTNSCQAMEKQAGPRRLAIASWQQKGSIFVSVTDSGPGIPEQFQQAIFGTLFTTKKSKGTGLGLAVIKTAMKRHNGSVQLDTYYKNGARFILEFPYAP